MDAFLADTARFGKEAAVDANGTHAALNATDERPLAEGRVAVDPKVSRCRARALSHVPCGRKVPHHGRRPGTRAPDTRAPDPSD